MIFKYRFLWVGSYNFVHTHWIIWYMKYSHMITYTICVHRLDDNWESSTYSRTLICVWSNMSMCTYVCTYVRSYVYSYVCPLKICNITRRKYFYFKSCTPGVHYLNCCRIFWIVLMCVLSLQSSHTLTIQYIVVQTFLQVFFSAAQTFLSLSTRKLCSFHYSHFYYVMLFAHQQIVSTVLTGDSEVASIHQNLRKVRIRIILTTPEK